MLHLPPGDPRRRRVPRDGRRAPRPQAREPADRRGVEHQDHRLRPLEHLRLAARDAADGVRLAVLRGAGDDCGAAVLGRQGRHLVARRLPLRDALRLPAVRGPRHEQPVQEDHGGHVQGRVVRLRRRARDDPRAAHDRPQPPLWRRRHLRAPVVCRALLRRARAAAVAPPGAAAGGDAGADRGGDPQAGRGLWLLRRPLRPVPPGAEAQPRDRHLPPPPAAPQPHRRRAAAAGGERVGAHARGRRRRLRRRHPRGRRARRRRRRRRRRADAGDGGGARRALRAAAAVGVAPHRRGAAARRVRAAAAVGAAGARRAVAAQLDPECRRRRRRRRTSCRGRRRPTPPRPTARAGRRRARGRAGWRRRWCAGGRRRAST